LPLSAPHKLATDQLESFGPLSIESLVPQVHWRGFQQSPSCVLRPATGSLLPASTRRHSSARRHFSLPLDPNPLLYEGPVNSLTPPRRRPKEHAYLRAARLEARESHRRGQRRRSGTHLCPTLLRSDLVESAAAWEGSCRRVRSALEASVVDLKAVGVRNAVGSLLVRLEEEGSSSRYGRTR